MNARRVYESLLWLYPKPFRERYGMAMLDTFVDLHDHARRTGLRFWLFVLTDAIRAASIQHLDRCASDDRRIAIRWLVACTVGTVLCNALGSALMWSFSYFYHPYLDGMTFIPSMYGVLLGTCLGTIQSLMFTNLSERIAWIVVSAASAALGLELASWIAPLPGPMGYGVVVGTTVAAVQWLTLRGRMKRPSAAALTSALGVSVAAVAGSVAVNQALTGLNALRVPTVAAAARLDAVSRVLYTPMNWSDYLFAVGSTAVAGLILGAITVKPASAWFARAQ